MSFPERTITSDPKRIRTVKVEVPTHVAGVLDFASGAVGHDHHALRRVGRAPADDRDLRHRGQPRGPGPELLRRPGEAAEAGAKTWADVPLPFGYTENDRGLGVADMADAIRANRPHRANGELLCHVLDVMEGIHDASRTPLPRFEHVRTDGSAAAWTRDGQIFPLMIASIWIDLGPQGLEPWTNGL